MLANGAAGPVDDAAFERCARSRSAWSLTQQIARDGEGATTLLEVTVDGARDDDQAKRVAKAIVNSPLVKTAVHGADPNWGRVAMAVGKCCDDTDIDQDRVVIRFGDPRSTPARSTTPASPRSRSTCAATRSHQRRPRHRRRQPRPCRAAT